MSISSPLQLFDANAFLGRRVRGTYRPAVDAKGLLAAMDEAGIREALVWHVAQLEYDPAEGNSMLAQAIRGAQRLWGGWTILPPQTRELPPPEELLESMRESRIAALRAFPDEHHYLLNRTVFGDLLDTAIKRSVPLFVSLTLPGMGWRGVYDLLADFPLLRCVLCDTGVWGTDRYFRPLLERYSGVMVETSLLGLGDGVLERLVQDYGAARFVFGTGFPEREPESAILPLLHAGIPPEDRARIAGLNLRTLLEAQGQALGAQAAEGRRS